MGFDLCLFEDEDVDEELICPICRGVLEEATYAPNCEHAFCSDCIHEWLANQRTCPLDRTSLKKEELNSVPRIMKNMLGKLRVKCENKEHGCQEIIRLDARADHSVNCEFNPKRPIRCEQCCLTIPKNELDNHNCIRDLRKQMAVINDQVTELKKYQTEQKERDRDLMLQINHLRELVRLNHAASPRTPMQPRITEILNWTESLHSARVTRWGGVISTPDSVLQRVIRRSLLESGCPNHIVQDLIENAHERRWPRGLSTLETRQLNRRYYDDYVTKRIPGKQAVVVLHCENTHMPIDMISDPGIVMIFAHGVEDV